MSDILDLIKSRRSHRHFTSKPVPDDAIDRAIEAGRWAPSGLNNQPWSFAVVRRAETRKKLSTLTRYGSIIIGAPALICAFMDNSKSYDRDKDCMAVGACIQNMLLSIHADGLGAVWLGEILKSKGAVAEVLAAPKELELMAVVALGYPESRIEKGKRRAVEEIVFYRE
jgi:nitroreductase